MNHDMISKIIGSRIKDGEYDVGSSIPTETELCDEFSASRYAVRQAITTLKNNGLVATRRRAGTVVLRKNPIRNFGSHLNTTDELNRYLQFTNMFVPNVIEELAGEGPQVGLEGDLSDWIMLETYRTVPNTRSPISWSNIYIRKEYRDVIKGIPSLNGGLYTLFESEFGEPVETIEIEISATKFPKSIAEHLGYTTSDPALLVIRRCRASGGKLLEVAESYYPPDEFKYMMTQHLGNS